MRKLLLVFFSLFYQALLAQEFGSIEGTITENEQVVEFANVFITPLNDSTKIVAGTVSNETGRFQMEKIPVGAYLLHIQLLGLGTNSCR
ncbi:MAG: carboxypeptidase-like regulatory domain-containing protein [Cyclobacteriaceae bacterium]|nr:carboxypeptidase-like regulatory domain-containing protein [Cyclobacteriaceae bacterium]